MSTPFWPDVSLLLLYHHWQIAQVENMSGFDDFSPSSINLNNYVPEESQWALLSSSFQIIVQPLLHTVKWFLFSLPTPFHPHTTTSISFWDAQLILPLATCARDIRKPFLNLFQEECLSSLHYQMWGILSWPGLWSPHPLSSLSSTYLLYIYQRHPIAIISQHMTFQACVSF